MTFWSLLLILSIVVIVASVIWAVKSRYAVDGPILLGTVATMLAIISLFLAILQPFSLSKTESRQKKERQQIEHQIAVLDETKDKVKLNEWILTYNDWINDVNTSKETFGWFSWYRDFDMTEHKIIELQ